MTSRRPVRTAICNWLFVCIQSEYARLNQIIDEQRRENEMLKENMEALEKLRLSRNDAYAEIEVQVEERVEQWKVCTHLLLMRDVTSACDDVIVFAGLPGGEGRADRRAASAGA